MPTQTKIDRALNALTFRERRILELRYGLQGSTPRSLHEIGRHYNLTPLQVRYISRKALVKLVTKGVRL